MYATVISAYPDKGWCVAQRAGACITRRRLRAASSDVNAARIEAQAFVGPTVTVIVPSLGERIPS